MLEVWKTTIGPIFEGASERDWASKRRDGTETGRSRGGATKFGMLKGAGERDGTEIFSPCSALNGTPLANTPTLRRKTPQL